MSEKQLSIGDDVRTLDDDQKQELYEGIRYVENIEEDIKDLRDDSNERKALIRERFGIDNDVLSFVLKRRKKKPDERANFDDIVTIIEEYVAEVEGQKADEAREWIEQSRQAHKASQDDDTVPSEPEKEVTPEPA